MLSEVTLAGLYLPPWLVYLCLALPLFIALRFCLLRGGVLRWVWHPALFEFALSFILFALMVLYV